jgi:hypothetical protein
MQQRLVKNHCLYYSLYTAPCCRKFRLGMAMEANNQLLNLLRYGVSIVQLAFSEYVYEIIKAVYACRYVFILGSQCEKFIEV